MGIGLAKIRQVKIPVSDLTASIAWYRRALDLDPGRGIRRAGRAARSRTGRSDQWVRDRAARPGSVREQAGSHRIRRTGLRDRRPADVRGIVAPWDDLGINHTDVWDGGTYGLGVDIRDPDGTVLRFLCDNTIGRSTSPASSTTSRAT